MHKSKKEKFTTVKFNNIIFVKKNLIHNIIFVKKNFCKIPMMNIRRYVPTMCWVPFHKQSPNGWDDERLRTKISKESLAPAENVFPLQHL